MAMLRTLNEFTRESVVLALEPARRCVASCTYCFAALNSAAQSPGREKDLSDNGSFESTYEKAFSPRYDPTNFLQWALVNRLPLGYANTVEPFQDAVQARGILSACEKADTPLFVQTKGVNFAEVSDRLRPFAGNAVIFVSFPSDNDKFIRSFEPRTPFSADRYRVIEESARMGFHVTLALAPFHPEFCPDPLPHLRRAFDAGAAGVFFDCLHLNRRQRDVIEGRLPVSEPVARDRRLIPLAVRSESFEPPDGLIQTYQQIYEFCRERDAPIFASGFALQAAGFWNTIPTVNPPGVFARGNDWPYNDGRIFHYLQWEFDEGLDPDEPDESDAFVITWDDARMLMDFGEEVEQEFSASSIMSLMEFRKIPERWKAFLGRAATPAEYYRALWNSPSRGSFAWRLPGAKIARKPNGEYWHDDEGNLVMLFDPRYAAAPGPARVCEDISIYRDIPIYGDVLGGEPG